MSTKNTPNGVGAEQLLATDDQVDHIKGLVSKQVRNLPRNDAQAIITNGDVFQAAFRRVLDDVREQLANVIIRCVKVNRSRTPQEVLDATGRKQYKNDAVVAAMPCEEGEEVEMVFFNLGQFVSDDKLAAEFEKRGLTPDPYAQAAVNEADPAFADDHPNGTHWRLKDGWGFLAFDHWDGERGVRVRRSDSDWVGGWWFGGVRKVS